VSGLGWSLKSLGRHRLRTALSIAGIAVSAAMLLDMVMLSGGIEKSFAELLLAKGYQIRLTPKGTLPFDTDATLSGVQSLSYALTDRENGVLNPLGLNCFCRPGRPIRRQSLFYPSSI